MNDVIDHVRSRVLDLVSQEPEELFDAHDVDQQVRKQDGLIRMFITQHQLNKKHDVEVISKRIVTTLKWRKSYGVPTMRVEDFPLELWQRELFTMHEDDEFLIAVCGGTKHQRISDQWGDVILRFAQFFHDKYALSAVHAGKKVITITDATGSGFSNTDRYVQEHNLEVLDSHFPCLADKTGIFGLPWILGPLVSFGMKFVMPASMTKTFSIYNKESIRKDLGEDRLPIQFGGTLVLKPLIDVSQHNLRSLKDNYEDWGLEEWEVKNILQSYGL